MNRNGDDGRLMSASELSEYMGITRNAAYTLLHRKDFPAIQIGSLLYAVRDQVDVWIARQARDGGYDYDEKTSSR